RIVAYAAYVIAGIFTYLHLFTDLFTNGLIKYYWGYYPRASVLHPVFLVFFMSLISLSIFHTAYSFIKRNSLFDDNRREQIKYMFWAYFLYAPACIDFLPNYGIALYPFGFVFSTAFLAMIAYAIARHQLMNIEVIVKKTLVFAGLLASVFAILVLPTLLIQDYIFRSAGTGGRLIGSILSGIIIILSLRRMEIFLINVTDRHLFQKKYDYRELLRTFTSEVLTVVNLDKLVNLTVDKLADIVKVSSSAVLLLNEEKRQFDVVASRDVKDPRVVLVRPDGIVTFLEQTHGYLLKKELIERRVYIPPSIQEIIDKLNAELIIPMVLHNDVMGILSLGKKKSDEDYSQDDLDILLPLARTLAIAISNARLFSELGKAQAEAAQREKMAVIGTLSAGINHEICNPLGIARGQCEAFLLNVKDGLYNNKSSEELLTKAKEIMTKVIKETDRATAITKKLSSFAKPAKGEAELVNIDKEIDDVLGLVGYELKLDKIEFEKHIEKDLPGMLVDKKQLQEVLFNLIRNAGQAIGEKGKIIVAVKQDEGKVFIDVKDTGSGIPDDKLKELFNPFFTTKEPGKGTGLGLFIVRQVVEKNGGKIYLKETKVGEGTTFTIEFPATTSRESRV
ncbi:MAG: ATP-binding protein, partial [Candidatus Omnitrophica bacterium]|nr:ATP-binding protein [Candidatus Omnitrophota bacterium]